MKKFLRQDNIVKHLVAGRHERLLERNSLRDTGIQIFASKLERIGHRELVSVVLENNTHEGAYLGVQALLSSDLAHKTDFIEL